MLTDDEVITKLFKKGLTPRQIQVFMQVSQGKTNKEVAEVLFISEKGVKYHLTNIFYHLKLKSRYQFPVYKAEL